ncbi:MAG TPA: PEP-CTERM sorting domain-containing protein [Myxococcota bacterium]|nr:PEP-CTERM sorting domain-containing protein [Myxococcota bacterium]
MRHPHRWLGRTLGALGVLLLSGPLHAAPITTSAAGVVAADIQATVDAFRAAVGNPNNGNNPGTGAGRREINWDGAGATTPTTSGTPLTAFTNTRGATMTTPGTGFIQASPAALATQFSNASYSTTFAAFSLERLFTPIGSNITDITFSVPGSNGATPAFVSAFGAIFSDVDTNATTMQFFSPIGTPLGTFGAPSLPGDARFSFIGVLFNSGEQIGRVRITTGSGALGPSDGPLFDAVAMDDFIYSEPVPEPGTLVLFGLGLSGLAVFGRNRRPSRD